MFRIDYFPDEVALNKITLVFHDNQIAILDDAFLEQKDLQDLVLTDEREIYVGHDDKNYYLAIDLKQPIDLEFQTLRSLLSVMNADQIQIASTAQQIVHWDQTNKFCGRCGTATEDSASERAKSCGECDLVIYPKVAPAIIVLVTRGEEMLLAQNAQRKTGFYSTLAGFVSPGETLEAALKREVFEEVGVKVKNIKYFGSQPWPFPNGLMVAFTAEYESGDIRIDGEEIADAKWFGPKNLPELPSTISIARQLIDSHLRGKT